MIVPIISIPKSGTHFITEILQNVARMRGEPFGYRFSVSTYGVTQHPDYSEIVSELGTLPKSGSYCYLSHWNHCVELESLALGYKSIFIFRNPLDIAVSFV